MNSRFSFIGEIDANSLDARVPYYREIKSDKANGLGLNLVVIAATNNRAFVEMAGFKNDVIKTYDPDGNELNIDWDDRFDATDKVANYKKNVITLDGDRHEFVSEYDFIKFVIEHIDEIKHKRFTATGQLKKNVYKGKISDKFVLQNLFEVKEDDEKKNQLRVVSEFFYNAEGIDTADWKKEKKLYINGYTKEYIDKDNKAVYVPRSVTFNCSKVDFENEMHVKRVKFKLALLNLGLDEDKITSKLKKSKYYAMSVVLSYSNGAEEIEFDESSLTPNQRLSIELGMKKLDDFKPKGSIYGNRVVEYKLVDYNLNGDYADGAVTLDESASDFEDNIYVVKTESLDDFEKAMNKPVNDVDEEDLFD